MKAELALLLLLVAASVATLAVVKEGRCPPVQPQTTLDIPQYSGIWYEYMRFPAPFSVGLECTSAVYTPQPDNSIKVRNEGYIRATLFDENYIINRQMVEGTAVVPDPDKPAELSVSFPPLESNDVINYNVLLTDYENYAVVFACQEVWSVNVQFAWILTRQRGVAPENINTIMTGLRNRGIDIGKFVIVDQEDCPAVKP